MDMQLLRRAKREPLVLGYTDPNLAKARAMVADELFIESVSMSGYPAFHLTRFARNLLAYREKGWK